MNNLRESWIKIIQYGVSSGKITPEETHNYLRKLGIENNDNQRSNL